MGPRLPRAIVVGAGLGGLGAAAELRRRGIGDITVLERAEDVGGVWRDNHYPGAACDVPSSLYSWSWSPNPGWTRRYARQPEILDYVRREARRSGLLDLVRTGARVTSARWDESAATWTVEVAGGRSYEAELLVMAQGQLSEPVVPPVPGADRFAGPAFHSARWDHEVDLAGRRVAVIGTGASAIQFVPRIVDAVGAMTVFQRTAPYVVPKLDRRYTALHRRAYGRFPSTQRFGRRLTWALSEQLNRAMTERGPLVGALETVWRLQLRAQVRDPALRARLVPDFPLGCKRLLFSNDWYPALTRDHVDVVTDDLVGVERDGVRTADGRLHRADVLIWGTGFAATRFLADVDVVGRDGARIHDVWRDGARAHLGMTVPGFPNLFLVYGPNTNLGGSSIITMMEAQARAIGRAAAALGAGRRALEVRADVADAYDVEIQDRLRDSVWAGCTSWYRERGGRISTNWPGLVREYVDRAAELALADFVPETSAPAGGDR
ncbi:cation diffusion facilitator CzcD-associated flavoprotein CzcO [Mumia flava]|uniref:Cation diffusion facilitator CzcD-associated flavoprotein CzcO n=1 Tax=Mumia flava TaxID=1348852 RepID=A0A0B2BPG7_9ACTN|nr:NAD(P)/FAD-dependent oxidoreductase [Mumia flava]PJJ56586.1 cation diffusion facilitator CzcD-associated flavoprotein CzcO [Mumia flava]